VGIQNTQSNDNTGIVFGDQCNTATNQGAAQSGAGGSSQVGIQNTQTNTNTGIVFGDQCNTATNQGAAQ
jgi:hypothetical protein